MTTGRFRRACDRMMTEQSDFRPSLQRCEELPCGGNHQTDVKSLPKDPQRVVTAAMEWGQFRMKSAFPKPQSRGSSSFGTAARIQSVLRNRILPALDGKRCFDIIGAALGLAALSPLFVLVIIIMSVRDPGPAFFGHERIGRHGRKFRCLKFRTMVRNADEVLERHLRQFPEAALEWRATQKLKQDPRVTPVGRMLRQTSLDELPQLLNVLRGEMSLVGPRPVVEDELKRYGSAQAEYLSVRPGMTGLWQVSGRNDTSYELRVALDKHYVRTRSFGRDCLILSRTVVVVFFQKGSY